MQCIQISILSPSIWPAIISTGRPFPADGPVGPFRLVVISGTASLTGYVFEAAAWPVRLGMVKISST